VICEALRKFKNHISMAASNYAAKAGVAWPRSFGPSYVHTSKALPSEWCEQTTAEQCILIKVNGKDTYRGKRCPRWEWLEQAVQLPQDLFSPHPCLYWSVAHSGARQPHCPVVPALLSAPKAVQKHLYYALFATIRVQ